MITDQRLLAPEISALLWPLDRLGEGLQALAARSGLQARAAQPAPCDVTAQPAPCDATAPVLTLPAALADAAVNATTSATTSAAMNATIGAAMNGDADVGAHHPDLARWIAWAAQQLGLQAEAVQSALPDVPQLLRQAGPAVILLASRQGPRFVLLLGRRGQRLKLLGPDQRCVACTVQALRDLLCAPGEAPLLGDIDRLLASAGVAPARQARARQALLAQRLAGAPLQGTWLLRQSATSGLWAQLAQARLPRRVGCMLAMFALLYALEIAGWRLIGQAALDGRLDRGWLAAWVLLLLTLVPLRLLSSGLNLGLALDVGVALRQRLLAGALRMDLDTLRRQGSGQLLARVIESQALESAGLAAALGLGVALLELGFATWVLAQGAAPALHAALLGAWLGLLALLAWRHQRQLRRWTEQRLDMTQSLVERMVGHRTRLAQEPPERRDAEEDHELQTCLQRSRALDSSLLPVVSTVPGGWLLLSLLALASALGAAGGGAGTAGLAMGAGPGAAALAISLGGILFAHRALAGVSGGLAALARASVAWRQVGPLFKAGAAAAHRAPFVPSPQAAAAPAGGPALVDAHGLEFGYRPGAALLRGADLQMAAHDHVLLAGPSGSGKSTLAALLVGLRKPSAGLLLLGGLDPATLGEQWQRWATEAPQFHDNHIFTGTLAFNLLMGHEWPPSPQALAEAQALCEELGLGPLLQRMPAGLQQRVGETGWQLSHGERSRVFLARALLQRARLTVLDESFAALDPQTLHRCLRCAVQRAPALVVIAHP